MVIYCMIVTEKWRKLSWNIILGIIFSHVSFFCTLGYHCTSAEWLKCALNMYYLFIYVLFFYCALIHYGLISLFFEVKETITSLVMVQFYMMLLVYSFDHC